MDGDGGKGKGPLIENEDDKQNTSMRLVVGEETSEEWNVKLMGKQCHHLQLSKEPLRFPIPKKCCIFFDEFNNHIVVVSELNVTIYPISGEEPIVEGNRLFGQSDNRLIGTKFSGDNKYVIVHYAKTRNKIDIMATDGRSRVVQACKKPRSHYILGFYWIFLSNFFLVTTNGVELYKFAPTDRRSVKQLKSFSHTVNWFTYSVSMRILLVSIGGSKQNVLQAYYFSKETIMKLPKFELECPSGSILSASNIVISQIYGKLYCQFIQPLGEGYSITLFRLTRENVMRERVIDLSFMPGKIETHVVDNMLIVHNIPQKISMIFDIKGREPESGVAPALPIAPFVLGTGEALLYEKSWEFLQPCHVMDITRGISKGKKKRNEIAESSEGENVSSPSSKGKSKREGLFWTVHANLAEISLTFSKKVPLISFLLRRSNSKLLLLQILRSLIEDRDTLLTISKSFDKINIVVSTARAILFNRNKSGGKREANNISNIRQALSADGKGSRGAPILQKTSVTPTYIKTEDGCNYVVIDQADMYTHIFAELEDDKDLDPRHFVSVLTEYIRSLNYHHIPVEHFLHELVINVLVRNARWYQLAQFLQYHVVTDSVHVACQLLSLEKKYPPAYQLALDMLKRLSSPEQIVEVLLARNQILPALRFIRNSAVKFSAVRFLEAVYDKDPTLYYTVFKFFERRSEMKKEDPALKPFYKRFAELFSESPERGSIGVSIIG